jgi:hypothetical protein
MINLTEQDFLPKSSQNKSSFRPSVTPKTNELLENNTDQISIQSDFSHNKIDLN